MPDLIELIKQQGQKEGFFYEPSNRNEPVQDSRVYDELSLDDKKLIKQVQKGERNSILLCLKGNFLLFEHHAEVPPRENVEKTGYQVYHYPLHKYPGLVDSVHQEPLPPVQVQEKSSIPDELVDEVRQLTQLAQAHQKISQAHQEISQEHKKISLESFDSLRKKLQAQESYQKASDQEQTRLIEEQTQLIKKQSRLISEKTPQSSASQLQFFNNLQSGLLWLFMTMILIASVFLVFQITRLENKLNNEVIANNVASKVPDALKDKGVTTEIIEQLNLNKVKIDEEKLSGLIATKLSSPKSDFIAQLAEKTADKMPAIESEKVTNAIAANLADTHGKAVEQVTKDEIATALANKLYAENKKTLIKQLNALKVSVAERVANKIDLEGTTIVVQDIVDKLVEQFNHKLDTEQFRIALKLAGKFEEIGDDGTWKKLKLASNNGEFISCPNKKGEGKWVESDKERYDQYDKKMYYCSGDGKNVTIYESISSKSLEQFGITIDEKGNLYYSPK
jgi:hypothetical protein